MALPATDNFDRANGAPGANWTGSVGGDLTITSNEVGGSSAGADNSMYWSADAPNADQYAQCTIVLTSAGQFRGPLARASATDWVVLDADGSTRWLLEWYNAGAFTAIGSAYGTSPATGDLGKITAEGSTFKGYINAVERISGTNGSAPATGNGGIYAYSNVGGGRVDNFEVGNLVVPVLAATGFPAIVGTVTQTLGTSASATPAVNLPSGCVAGETICVLFRVAVAGSIGWPDGTWNELFDVATDASDDQMAFAWRKATGAEGATITLSCTSGKFAALSWRVQGATDPSVRSPEISTIATGTSTTPDPTAVTPTGGTKNYLWGWMGGWEGEQTSPPSSNPTSYTLSVTGADSGVAGVGTTNCRVAVAFRQLNGSTADPGSWTISASDDWTAYAIAFHPADLPPPPRLVSDAVHRAGSW